MLYRFFTRNPTNDVPSGDFIRYSFGNSTSSTEYRPGVYNYVVWPSPGTFPPPTHTPDTVPSGSQPFYTTFYAHAPTGASHNCIVFGSTDVPPVGTGQQIHGMTFTADQYWDDLFCAPNRQGFTLEYWGYQDSSYESPTNPVLFLVGPYNSATGIKILNHNANLTLGPSTLPARNNNAFLFNNANNGYYGANEIGTPYEAGITSYGTGWRHYAFVENLLDNTFKTFVNGVLRSTFTGYAPYLTAGAVLGKTIRFGGDSKTSKMAEFTLTQLPKYTNNFTPPFNTSFT